MEELDSFKRSLEKVWSAWRKVVAMAWSDDAFKERLLSDEILLEATLKEAGSPEIPDHIELKIEQDMEILQPIVDLRKGCLHLVLPPAPSVVERPHDHRRFCCC